MRKLLILPVLLACLLAGCGRDTGTTEPTREPFLETNPYTESDFTYAGERLVCTAADAVTGIDVSVFQGDIDWEAVAADGVEFAMIRLGYRGIVDGLIDEDDRARENIEGALAAGLDVGVYFFSQAVTPGEAAEEAAFVIDFIAGYDIAMPVAFDWEHVENPEARTAQVTERYHLTDCALAFLEAVEAAGHKPMIYFNRYQADDLLDLWLLRRYDFWLALYDAPMTFPWQIAMWQYTDHATVAGIPEKVDMNLYFP